MFVSFGSALVIILDKEAGDSLGGKFALVFKHLSEWCFWAHQKEMLLDCFINLVVIPVCDDNNIEHQT